MIARRITPRLSRREFVRHTGMALGAGLWLGQAKSSAALATSVSSVPAAGQGLVGSNIFGWGQYYQRQNQNLNEHLDEVLSALHDSGYHYLEGNLDVNQPDNNLRLADRMRSKGLQPVTLYTGGQFHEEGKSGAVVRQLLAAAKVCQTAGFRLLSCNPNPIGRDKTEAELRTQAVALDDFGRGLKDLGMQLGVHNHTPEMANEAREFHYNFRHTDPQWVGFCYDIHWVYRGGVPPSAALKEYGERIVSWHLRQSRQGVWWEDLDTGDLDFEAVASYVKAHQLARMFTVELAIETGTKITRSVVENHRRSREFIRRTFGV